MICASFRASFYWWLLLPTVLGTSLPDSCNGPVSGCTSWSLLQKEEKQSRLGSVTEASADLVEAADSVFQMAQANGVAAQTHVISHLSREQNMQAQYLEKLAQQQVSVEQKESAYLERLEKRLAYQEKTIDALSKIALVSAHHAGTGQSPATASATGAAKDHEDLEAVKMPQELVALERTASPAPRDEQRRQDFQEDAAAPPEQQQQLRDEEETPVALTQGAADKAKAEMSDEEKREKASKVSFFDIMTLRWSIR